MDEQSSSVPLSLGSVAKRLTKQMLRECRKVTTLKQQVLYVRIVVIVVEIVAPLSCKQHCGWVYAVRGIEVQSFNA